MTAKEFDAANWSKYTQVEYDRAFWVILVIDFVQRRLTLFNPKRGTARAKHLKCKLN